MQSNLVRTYAKTFSDTRTEQTRRRAAPRHLRLTSASAAATLISRTPSSRPSDRLVSSRASMLPACPAARAPAATGAASGSGQASPSSRRAFVGKSSIGIRGDGGGGGGQGSPKLRGEEIMGRGKSAPCLLTGATTGLTAEKHKAREPRKRAKFWEFPCACSSSVQHSVQ